MTRSAPSPYCLQSRRLARSGKGNAWNTYSPQGMSQMRSWTQFPKSCYSLVVWWLWCGFMSKIISPYFTGAVHGQTRGACKLRKAAEPLNPSVPLVPLDRSTAASSIQLFPCADRADSWISFTEPTTFQYVQFESQKSNCTNPTANHYNLSASVFLVVFLVGGVTREPGGLWLPQIRTWHSHNDLPSIGPIPPATEISEIH